jgi:hypothetical protein
LAAGASSSPGTPVSEDEPLPRFSVPRKIQELIAKCNEQKAKLREQSARHRQEASKLRSALSAASAEAEKLRSTLSAASTGTGAGGSKGGGKAKGSVAKGGLGKGGNVEGPALKAVLREPLDMEKLVMLGRCGGRILLASNVSAAQQAFVDYTRMKAAKGGGLVVGYREDRLCAAVGVAGRLCAGLSSLDELEERVQELLPRDYGFSEFELTSSPFCQEKCYREFVRDARARDIDIAKSFPNAVLARHPDLCTVAEYIQKPEVA